MTALSDHRLTDLKELLYRQISPAFWEVDKRPSSQIFRPSSKDDGLLAVDRGSMRSAEASHQAFGFISRGVFGLTVEEVEDTELSAFEDPTPNNPAHAVVDFRSQSRGQQEKKAKKLLALAEARGLCYVPAAPPTAV